MCLGEDRDEVYMNNSVGNNFFDNKSSHSLPGRILCQSFPESLVVPAVRRQFEVAEEALLAEAEEVLRTYFQAESSPCLLDWQIRCWMKVNVVLLLGCQMLMEIERDVLWFVEAVVSRSRTDLARWLVIQDAEGVVNEMEVPSPRTHWRFYARSDQHTGQTHPISIQGMQPTVKSSRV